MLCISSLSLTIEINQRIQHQSKNNAFRRIGLHQGDPIAFEKLPTQLRPPTLASLIPPIVAPPITTGSVQNPYATSRKRTADTAPDARHVNPTNHRRQDMASIVLGRPTQPLHTPIISTASNNHESMSRKNHRRRVYRDRWEFGCSVGIGTTTETNDSITVRDATCLTTETPTSPSSRCFDGDAAGGAAVQSQESSNRQGSITPPQTVDQVDGNWYDPEKDCLPDEDDDVLSFVAFPTAHGRFTS